MVNYEGWMIINHDYQWWLMVTIVDNDDFYHGHTLLMIIDGYLLPLGVDPSFFGASTIAEW